jgi:hypothetical protein
MGSGVRAGGEGSTGREAPVSVHAGLRHGRRNGALELIYHCTIGDRNSEPAHGWAGHSLPQVSHGGLRRLPKSGCKTSDALLEAVDDGSQCACKGFDEGAEFHGGARGEQLHVLFVDLDLDLALMSRWFQLLSSDHCYVDYGLVPVARRRPNVLTPNARVLCW